MTSRQATILVYVGIGLLLLGLELLARTTERVPTFGTLLRAALRHRSAQLGLVLAWWWLGWHFLADS